MTKIIAEVSDMGTRRRVTESVAIRSSARLGRVLVVEDEQDVAELIRYHLAKEGYDVRVSPQRRGRPAPGPRAPARASSSSTSWCPSSTAGRSAAASSRTPETRGIPVIMVTGRVEEGDKVLGFELGADDYVTKPFSPRELVARVRAVLRRGTAAEPRARKAPPQGSASSRSTATASRSRMQGRPVELTRKEFELLAALVATPGRVFGREELLDLVWGRDGFVEPRTVDVHVARLRGKFTAAKPARARNRDRPGRGLPLPGRSRDDS